MVLVKKASGRLTAFEWGPLGCLSWASFLLYTAHPQPNPPLSNKQGSRGPRRSVADSRKASHMVSVFSGVSASVC